MGVSSLAVGVVAGAFLGYLTLNLWGAYRIGVRFRVTFDLAHPGLCEWIRLSLPLMLGVTVVTADRWILRNLHCARDLRPCSRAPMSAKNSGEANRDRCA